MAKDKLLVTTKSGEDMHYHVSYVDFDNGVYMTLPSKDGHTHPVREIPAEEVPVGPDGQPALQPINVDPMTGQPMSPDFVDPSTGTQYQMQEDGSFLIYDEQVGGYRPLKAASLVIEPGEDGHIHKGFRTYARDLSKKKEKEDEVVKDVFEFFKYCNENEQSSLKKGAESWDFVKGDQWSDTLKSYLTGVDRACVTINKLPGIVDTFVGFLIENRQDISYSPIEEGDALAAEINSRVLKLIYSKCNYGMAEIDVFTDQIVPGRGWFEIYFDKNSSLEGDLGVKCRKWNSIVCLDHESRDLKDCEGLVRKDIYSFSKLKSLFPKKAEQIQKDVENYETGVYDGDEYQTKDRSSGDHYSKGEGAYAIPRSHDGTNMVDVAKKEFTVLTRWMKVYEKGQSFVFTDTDYDHNLKGWKESDIKLLEEIPGATVIEKDVQRIRITKIAGNTVISDENVADLPVDEFFNVPAYGYFKDGDFWGKVECLKDPQRELNQRRSQIIDIGNKCCSYGYFIDQDTFENPQDATTFINTSTRPGGVWKVADVNRPPLSKEGIKFPNELVQLAQMAEATIDSLGNINVEMDEGQSGEHLLQVKRHKLTSNAIIFENFKMARIKTAELMLPLIYRFYSPERIYEMLTSDGNDLMGQPISEFSIEDIREALENSPPTSFNIEAIETEYSPTTRLAVQMILTKLSESGADIPIESILGTIDMPAAEKQKLLQNVEDQKQSSAGQQQAGVDGEVEKTLIAGGLIPASTAERMQLDQAKPIEFYRGNPETGEQPQVNQGEFPDQPDSIIPGDPNG